MRNITLLALVLGLLSLGARAIETDFNYALPEEIIEVDDLEDGFVELGTPGSKYIDPQQDMKDAAYASRLVYKDLETELVPEPYEVVMHSTDNEAGPKANEFKGLVLHNKNSKKLFVAFQGTKKKDVKFIMQDLGILSSNQEKVRKYMVDYWTKSGFFDDLSWKGAIMNLLSIFDATYYADKFMPEWMRDMGKKGHKFVSSVGGDPVEALINGMKNAMDFYDSAKKMADEKFPGQELLLTGHSLGGFHAQVISSVHGLTAYVFNAPAAKDIFETHKANLQKAMGLDKPFKSFNESKIHAYVRQGDMIGFFGDFKGKRTIYPAYASKDSVDTPASFVSFLKENHSMNNFAPAILGGQEEMPDPEEAAEESSGE